MSKEKEIHSLLLKLADQDIRQIFLGYEGSGDSGAIEEIYASKTAFEHDEFEGWYFDIPDEFIDDFKPLMEIVSHDVIKRVEELAYDLVLHKIEDWYNNDGGYGFIVIDIPSGKTHNRNSVRIMNTENFTNSFNLAKEANETWET